MNMNLLEALDILIHDPDAKGIFSIQDGWSITVKREGNGFLVRRDQVGGILSEETHFADEGALLAHFAHKKA